jgi:hypothetical protein
MTSTVHQQPATATTLKPEELQWRPVDPHNPSGPQMAALWGHPTSGPYGALLRVPAGFESPMHRHSSDERVVVLQGASVHWVQGEDPAAAPTMASRRLPVHARGPEPRKRRHRWGGLSGVHHPGRKIRLRPRVSTQWLSTGHPRPLGRIHLNWGRL